VLRIGCSATEATRDLFGPGGEFDSSHKLHFGRIKKNNMTGNGIFYKYKDSSTRSTIKVDGKELPPDEHVRAFFLVNGDVQDYNASLEVYSRGKTTYTLLDINRNREERAYFTDSNKVKAIINEYEPFI
jgi:hypothetical protein